MKHRFFLFLVLLASWSGWQMAQAQSGYPVWEDLYVNDFAQVIDSNHENQIRTLLNELYNETDVEATVLTINSIDDYDTGDSSIESFATNLFNEWGIGDAARNDGILLLVAIEDRELRIEIGAGYSAADEDGLGAIIDRVIVPRFQEGAFSLGIYEGAQAIVNHFQDGVTTGIPVAEGTTLNTEPVTVPATSSTPNTRSGLDSDVIPWLAGGGTLGVLGAGVAGLSRFKRYRKRTCPSCNMTDMVRLDESADDAFLQEGQRLEESLQSVDYDVWECPNCRHHEVIPYVAWFSRYKQCPQCSHRALEIDSSVVQQPTYTSTGLRRTTYDCRNCSHRDVRESTIPRKVRSTTSSSSGFSSRSSSSSRSSFGGGRSSGGGRSGKW